MSRNPLKTLRKNDARDIPVPKDVSYEARMLSEFAMPPRAEVEHALLRTLMRNGGVIRDFGTGQPIVNAIADELELSRRQRLVYLETVYRKENRNKRALLWHRLLFRAGDSLAKSGLVTRPTQTIDLTGRREWMLTEKGIDVAARLCAIPPEKKACLQTRSFEVEKIVKRLVHAPAPRKDYDPFDRNKQRTVSEVQCVLRHRGFRQAVSEAYDYKCAVCGLKLPSPDALFWEVEAAHIVPNRLFGRDDIWNGIAFCHTHHWAFDVGWFAISDDYTIRMSVGAASLPNGFGQMNGHSLFQRLVPCIT